MRRDDKASIRLCMQWLGLSKAIRLLLSAVKDRTVSEVYQGDIQLIYSNVTCNEDHVTAQLHNVTIVYH